MNLFMFLYLSFSPFDFYYANTDFYIVVFENDAFICKIMKYNRL